MYNTTNDAAYRTFYISEILRVILDNLTHDKRSIVSLAYSSKAVSGIALDYLWADMDSFSPFIPFLPKSVQDIWGLSFNVTVSSLIRRYHPKEWELFDTYAYRVRHIRPGDDYPDRALFQMLVSARNGVDPFPRLLSLECHLFDPLTPGKKIFPLSLRSLSLHTEYGLVLDGRAELALRQAAQDAPLLEELYVVGTYRLCSDTGLRPVTFKRLRTVHLMADKVRPADLQSFSRLLSTSPILNLGISLRSSSEATFQPLDESGATATTFPYVEKISICDGPRRATDILSSISSPYLRSVTIDHRDRCGSVSEYARLFTLLAQRHPPVYSLEIRIGRIYVNTRNEYVRGFLAALEPLVHSGLVRLKVDMALYDAWKIEEDVKMRLRPEAWPTLVYFEFVLTEASAFGTFAMAQLR